MLSPIHPFPARMAPEIALDALRRVEPGSVVFDPMCGSGMVIRAAIDKGCHAIGRDIDPLAVLMTQVWTTPLDAANLIMRCDRLLERAFSIDPRSVSLPWIDARPATQDFINFWFAEEQVLPLRQLAYALRSERGAIGRALRLGLSKIIVTKWRGASRAGDTAHSRPHRVRDSNDFDVLNEYEKSVRSIAKALSSHPPRSTADVRIGDATSIRRPSPETVDLVITSPPYGSAIDYMRGHKLALVWLGHELDSLAKVRSRGIGVRRYLISNKKLENWLNTMVSHYGIGGGKIHTTLMNFALGVYALLRVVQRALKPETQAVIAIGDFRIGEIEIESLRLIEQISDYIGLDYTESYQRSIPTNRRYLPPPATSKSDLAKRLSVENIITLRKVT